MKLTHIEIKNYRSIFHDYKGNQTFNVDLSDGVNAITGPNNAGKSNILRALALALDPNFEFDRKRDMPSIWDAWSKPVVTLTFHVPPNAPSRERTLLRRLETYEKEVNPRLVKTFASKGEVRLRVTIEQNGDDPRGTRRRTFVVAGAGAKQLGHADKVTRAALDQFDKCLQFVWIRSGESLESLLQGRFREVLQAVLNDEDSAMFAAAEKSRGDYVQALQDGLLASLRDRIATELVDLFPEVNAVVLEPNVRGLESTLTSMKVEVSDVALTDLAEKGTGVRGGLIVAMLQHLAVTSKRSIVFAVEEPESFLHPAAQEALRADLESLASRNDVSMLMTTHSPYVISRAPHARVIGIRKDDKGRTIVDQTSDGNEPLQDVLGGLFRGSLLLGFLDRDSKASPNEKAILVVEGQTDRDWLEHATILTGRADLLDGLTLEPAGGAQSAVAQALFLEAISSRPVAVLFDDDPDGKNCLSMMRGFEKKNPVWKYGQRVFSYRTILNEQDGTFGYEAEDMWPSHLHEAFLSKADRAEVLAEQVKRPNPIGGFHYGYTPKGKEPFSKFVQKSAMAADCVAWIALLERVRAGLGI